MRDSYLRSSVASPFSGVNSQVEKDDSSDVDEEGDQSCSAVAPATGASQQEVIFINCDCGRARILRSVYSLQVACSSRED